jgi:Flp pilus assembly protein TadD
VGVERAWDRYVALEPDPPDDTAASYMVQAFSAGGLNKPEKAVRALEMVIEVRGDNANLYSQLAVIAYQAGQTRKGDLAADKAVRLAPEADRKLLRENLDAAKSEAASTTPQQTVTATPSPGSTTDTTSTTG